MRWRTMFVDQLQLASCDRLSGKRMERLAAVAARLAVVILTVLLCVSSVAALAQRPMQGRNRPMRGQPGSYVTAQAIVALKNGSTEADLANALTNANAQVVRPL